ncbi:MAG: hypothetical protein AAFX00_03645 [Pseudomonadota bacterium]
MIRALGLLLPALLPSWRFFDSIGPSPRIEVAGPDGVWREFRPRPRRVPPGAMARRLLWNACWNEDLFLTSLAERMIRDGSDHARREILTRIRIDEPYDTLRFRLVTVTRVEDRLRREVLWTSPPDHGADPDHGL